MLFVFVLGYNPETESHLFPELLKFNILTRKWSRVFTQYTDGMPKESVSNAITIKDDTLLVERTLLSISWLCQNNIVCFWYFR